MKIAVCDGNPADRQKLCDFISIYCGRHAITGSSEGFANGADLLRRMRATPYPILFLDISPERGHDVELARTIRKQFKDCILFFCANSGEFALEAFEVGALHYLVKPIAYQQVEAAMNRCGGRLASQARTLLLSQKQQTKVLVRDILYVEVFDKTCFIHTAARVESTRKTIGCLERELGTDGFLRCHRSYIINLEYVRECGDVDFILPNGVSIPIRQAGRSRIKGIYRDYIALRAEEKL